LKNVEEKYDLTSLNEKQKLANELLNILKSYSDIIEKDYYLKEISKKLDISLNVLYDLFSKMSQTKVKKVTQETTSRVSAVDLAI
jgi:DNA primase